MTNAISNTHLIWIQNLILTPKHDDVRHANTKNIDKTLYSNHPKTPIKLNITKPQFMNIDPYSKHQ